MNGSKREQDNRHGTTDQLIDRPGKQVHHGCSLARS